MPRVPQTICQRRDSAFSDQIHEWRKMHHQLLMLGEHRGRLRGCGRSTGPGVKSLAPAPHSCAPGPVGALLWASVEGGWGPFFLRLFLVAIMCLGEPGTAPGPLLQGLLSQSLCVTLLRTKFILLSTRSVSSRPKNPFGGSQWERAKPVQIEGKVPPTPCLCATTVLGTRVASVCSCFRQD